MSAHATIVIPERRSAAMRDAAGALAVAADAASMVSDLLLLASVAPDLASIEGASEQTQRLVEGAGSLRAEVEVWVRMLRPDVCDAARERLALAESAALHRSRRALEAAALRGAQRVDSSLSTRMRSDGQSA
jgi:hypothetical protein